MTDLPLRGVRSRYAGAGAPFGSSLSRPRLAVFLLMALVLLAGGGCRRESDGRPQPPPPPKLVSEDPWRLTIQEPGPARAYLGNGYLGLMASHEGLARDGDEALRGFLSGFYRNEAFTPGPAWANLGIRINDRPVTAQDAGKYEQVLDLRRGVLVTRYRWRGRPAADVEITLFPARHEQYLGVVQVAITPTRRCKVTIQGAVPTTPECAAQVVDVAGPEGQTPTPLAAETELESGQRWVFTRYAGICADVPPAGTTRESLATAAAKQAAGVGFEETLRRHTAEWEKLWARDIAIEGDARVQQVLNAFRYCLLASVREGRADSVPPMGLSSDVYQGHIFWDADTWVFPALVPQYPELARSLVEYRFRTLPAARENARAQGLPGADYAWESAATGKETVGGEFSLGRHVNADIALAQWQYYLWTGDRAWLRTRGYPVLRATADYWIGRVRHNRAADRYEIPNVMGPDETRGPVDNNAWTNSMAQLNLELAARAAALLGEKPDPRWSSVAAKLWIPFDKANGRYLQCEGYQDGKHKQADCELILYPRRLPMPKDVAERTYDYYKANVMQYGPAMTSSIYAVIAAQLGRREEAATRFKESWEPFLVAPYHLYSEKRTSPRTCFVTGLAGTLQSVLYGFAGLEPTETELRAAPILPSQWQRLRITGIRWRGQERSVEFTP